ncbi:bifunctional precorrin-2 dehydrogenase/sirohydrochlorin ferrochelatase [Sphingosinithalassobacter sp. CS137]|uniref:precorrin-2 dehydrogenase/sirohydrochlorin ferrochelatase family protein n=1 Tax=Sphingosinithalassobacter sp. CS137 TaxID=2762748 RepID=UPI00165D513E|nr:NAD(P)-dependent oxidoreductase [Sphingosinithalassobacter sp. CS137]
MKAGLPVVLRLAGRPVILLGEGEAAAAKRRLLERAGASVIGEEGAAQIAIVAIEDAAEAEAAVARLKARGLLVNAVDRPGMCDFTTPAIIDRDPLLVAVATGGASAGLAASVRQRIEALLPADLGGLAQALAQAREAIRDRWPEGDARRRALGSALAPGGPLDPLGNGGPARVEEWLATGAADDCAKIFTFRLTSADPDDLTLRQARALAFADRVTHRQNVPPAILNRARADADRIACAAPPADPGPGLTVDLEMA